ncbi:hypothetical protein MMAR_2545 [Mycobacterium marinum M]|uniref:Uncharacterized protein n=1 Tax=Mycobacterium marinum (strain ATCC BAA-535 / M) TaxID=216594 RepID=B2HRW2_MYCMM|nr:hypothetical protein MMAR_2545 [Mycobacterium marinum M]
MPLAFSVIDLTACIALCEQAFRTARPGPGDDPVRRDEARYCTANTIAAITSAQNITIPTVIRIDPPHGQLLSLHQFIEIPLHPLFICYDQATDSQVCLFSLIANRLSQPYVVPACFGSENHTAAAQSRATRW